MIRPVGSETLWLIIIVGLAVVWLSEDDTIAGFGAVVAILGFALLAARYVF